MSVSDLKANVLYIISQIKDHKLASFQFPSSLTSEQRQLGHEFRANHNLDTPTSDTRYKRVNIGHNVDN